MSAVGSKRSIISRAGAQSTASSPFTVDLESDYARAQAASFVRDVSVKMAAQQAEHKRSQMRAATFAAAAAAVEPLVEEIEVLRAQRRVLDAEERRLRALLDIEKSMITHRAEIIAARVSSKQEREAQLALRRASALKTIEEQRQQHLDAELVRLGLVPVSIAAPAPSLVAGGPSTGPLTADTAAPIPPSPYTAPTSPLRAAGSSTVRGAGAAAVQSGGTAR